MSDQLFDTMDKDLHASRCIGTFIFYPPKFFSDNRKKMKVWTMSIYSTITLLSITALFNVPTVQAIICTDSRVCTFYLTVGSSRTMNYRGADHGLHLVTFNGSQPVVSLPGGLTTLSMEDFVIADGFVRDVILFNGTLPGPAIEVIEGAQVGGLTLINIVSIFKLKRSQSISIFNFKLQFFAPYKCK